MNEYKNIALNAQKGILNREILKFVEASARFNIFIYIYFTNSVRLALVFIPK